MDHTRWTMLLTEEDTAKFCKSLAQIVWTPYDLSNRAVDIRNIPIPHRTPNRSPVKELEKDKLRLMISKYNLFITNFYTTS